MNLKRGEEVHVFPHRGDTMYASTFSALARRASTAIAFGVASLVALADAANGQTAASPWGISSSAGSYQNHTEWFPKMSAIGVSTVRLFPEWGNLEPQPGKWQWQRADALVRAAAEHKIEINAILMGSMPGTEGGSHAFPMKHLDEWSKFVSTTVARYKDQVRYWEVWNEGNGGFNDGRHTTVDYARLAAATHAAAKAADPRAQVGLTVASFDPAYLDQAIRAMARDGRPDSFDFLCIHPYEIADGLADPDGEIPYLWMTRMMRDALAVGAPQRAKAEIWITEIGRRIGKHGGRTVTELDAARDLVKLYTMAVAQGISRTQWFEAQDPVGEDAGFGLLNRDGSPRASYHAMKNLTAQLGRSPKYVGWLALGDDRRGYGFVFEGASNTVLVAWMPRGATANVAWTGDGRAIDAVSGTESALKAGQPLALSDAPVFVVGLAADLVALAKANAARNFPWGGDHSQAKTVSVTLGKPNGSSGVFQRGGNETPHCTFADGSTGIIVRGDQPVAFYVHPSFADLQTREFYVRVTVRRLTGGNLGMNLFYEMADSQGRTPYKNREQWYGVGEGNDWQTHTWHVTDACLAKMWGYDISVRPEQSVPFVIGKIEVSKTPFE
jgi:hypothetical protein